MSLHRGRPSRRAGLLAGAAGVALAALVAVAVTAQATRPQACESLRAAPVAALLPRAAIPTGTAFRAGVATFYGPDPVSGACSFVERAPGGYTTALGPAEYSAGAACGMTLEVKGRRGTVRVKVTNLCPECPAGHLDLTNEAFAKVDDPAKGRVAISYRVVNDPPLPGPLTVRVKEGSSQWWLGLLVDQHGNALRTVEVSSAGHPWKALARTDYNYWLASSGAGRGPFSVRVTDVRGHRVTLPGITLKPGVVQRTAVRMYPAAVAAGGAAPATTGTPTATRSVAVAPVTAAPASPPATPAAAVTAVSSSTGRPGTSTPGPGPLAAGAAPAPTAPQGCR